MKGLSLSTLWAYKYGPQDNGEVSGINVHADDATVQLNLWLTPSEANHDVDSGGLVIYHVETPESWSFREYNSYSYNGPNIDRVLGSVRHANTTVSYKQNRGILFHSKLFHVTDSIDFKSGVSL